MTIISGTEKDSEYMVFYDKPNCHVGLRVVDSIYNPSTGTIVIIVRVRGVKKYNQHDITPLSMILPEITWKNIGTDRVSVVGAVKVSVQYLTYNSLKDCAIDIIATTCRHDIFNKGELIINEELLEFVTARIMKLIEAHGHTIKQKLELCTVTPIVPKALIP